jgi:hypothetical protein
MNATIKELVNGNAVLDIEGQVVYMVGIVLASKKDGTLKSGIAYTMDEMKEFKAYTSPELEEINRLNAQIAVMSKELANKCKKQAVVEGSRAAYNHLNVGEIREIEELFANHLFDGGKRVDVKLIFSTYNTSQAVVSRIRNGKHPKSSEAYKARLLTYNLGEK